MVAVAYRGWSFTRGSNHKALTEKILVFWSGGNLWEVVSYKRWSHIEVWLYMYFSDQYTYIVCNTSLLLYFISKTNHDIGLLLLCLLFVPVCQYSVNSSLKADHLIPAALWIGDPVREQTVQDRFPIIKITVMINITGQILLNLMIKLHEMLTHGKLKYKSLVVSLFQ